MISRVLIISILLLYTVQLTSQSLFVDPTIIHAGWGGSGGTPIGIEIIDDGRYVLFEHPFETVYVDDTLVFNDDYEYDVSEGLISRAYSSIVKFDENNELVDAKFIRSGKNRNIFSTRTQDICQADEVLYICGQNRGDSLYVNDELLRANEDLDEAFVLGFDKDLNVVFEHYIDLPGGSVEITSIDVQDSLLYIGGSWRVQEFISFGSDTLQVSNLFDFQGITFGEAFLAVYDMSTSEYIHAERFGGPLYEWIRTLEVSESREVYIGIQMTSAITVRADTFILQQAHPDDDDHIVIKINSDFSLGYVKHYASLHYNDIKNMQLSDQGELLLSGTNMAFIDDIESPPDVNHDFRTLLCYDEVGNLKWSKLFDNEEGVFVHKLVVKGERAWITGVTRANTFVDDTELLFLHEGGTTFLMELDIASGEILKSAELHTVQQNPIFEFEILPNFNPYIYLRDGGPSETAIIDYGIDLRIGANDILSEYKFEEVLNIINEYDEKVSIFPNPISDNLTLYIEEVRDGTLVRIYDLSGHLYMTSTLYDGQLHLHQDIPNGIYIIKIMDEVSLTSEPLVILK